jgi:hypothetical protein
MINLFYVVLRIKHYAFKTTSTSITYEENHFLHFLHFLHSFIISFIINEIYPILSYPILIKSVYNKQTNKQTLFEKDSGGAFL